MYKKSKLEKYTTLVILS